MSSRASESGPHGSRPITLARRASCSASRRKGRETRSLTQKPSMSRSHGDGSTARSARSTQRHGSSASALARRTALGRRSTARRRRRSSPQARWRLPASPRSSEPSVMDGGERAYDGARTASVPADLATAFARSARARAFFETLDSANRYAILYRVQTAKNPETRAARIEHFVGMCARHQTLHSPRRAKAGARAATKSQKARRGR